MTTTILALDLGTTTGWALRGSDGDVRQSFMSVHLEKRLNPLSGDQYGE